jgi:hypothetical protein
LLIESKNKTHKTDNHLSLLLFSYIILDQIKSETENYIVTQKELEELISAAEQQTDFLTKQIEDFYQIEIDFELDEQDEGEITIEESPDIAQNIFITRDSTCVGQNLETPAIKKSLSRLNRH